MNLFNHGLLKEYRKERGLTQLEAAKKLGVARTTYADYEKGKIQPPIDKIQRISMWLDVPTSDLMQAENDTGIDVSKVPFEKTLSDSEKIFMVNRIKEKVHIYETFDLAANMIFNLDIPKTEKNLILDLMHYISENYALTSAELRQYDKIREAENND